MRSVTRYPADYSIVLIVSTTTPRPPEPPGSPGAYL